MKSHFFGTILLLTWAATILAQIALTNFTCTDAECCRDLATPNPVTGDGFLEFSGQCLSEGLGCVDSTGCLLCHNGNVSVNLFNRPTCGAGAVFPLPICSSQTCCDGLMSPNTLTGYGYLQFTSNCTSGGPYCVDQSGCLDCFNPTVTSASNVLNRPVCSQDAINSFNLMTSTPLTQVTSTQVLTSATNTLTIPLTTQIPATSVIPVTTQIPVTSVIPVTTQIPVTSAVPVTSAAPVTTQIPATSTQTTHVTVPLTTQAPATTQILTTQAPVTTQVPIVTTQVPIVSTQILTTQTPVTTQAPIVTTQVPVVTEQAPTNTVIATTTVSDGESLAPVFMLLIGIVLLH